MSDMEEVPKIKSFTGEFYTLNKLERKIFPKELEVFYMLNRNTTNDFSEMLFNQKSNTNNNSNNNLNMNLSNTSATNELFEIREHGIHHNSDDLKKRKGKLIDKTLLVYVNTESEQLLTTLDLQDSYLEVGSKYKINNNNNNNSNSNNVKGNNNALFNNIKDTSNFNNNNNNKNQIPNTLYSFNIWKNQRNYAFYVASEDERNQWIKQINSVIGSNEITNNYYFTKTIYVNQKKHLIVKRARRKIDGKLLAIKKYTKIDGNNEQSELLNMTWKDVSIINVLKHPYVLKIFDKVEDKDSVSLVFEYCSGGTLYEYLEKREFALEERLGCRIIFQLCSVVSYLHSYNLIHRNLNLENILMTDDSDNADIRLIGFSNSKYLKPGEMCLEYSGLIVSLCFIFIINFTIYSLLITYYYICINY
jgi:hypothetical protein